MQRFYAFADRKYKEGSEVKVFDYHDDLLKFVKEAMDPDGSYVSLKVIYGEEVEFEPATYVESYRIKE